MAVLNVHHPLALTFGLLGNLISFTVFLAPVPTFFRIYKKKSTEGFQSLPYLVALFSSMLWLYYAIIKKDALLLTTINSSGCVIETIYVIIYIIYAPKEKKVSTMKFLIFLNVGLLSFIALVTQFLVKESIQVQVLGWICVVVSATVFAAPLFIMAQVVRTKSVEFMPFALSLFLTLSAVMWFAYGLFTSDLCVALPNVFGFILGLLQMVLYAVYRNAEKIITDEKKPQDLNLRSIVILSPLRAAEVYPSEIQLMQNKVAELENPKPEPRKNEKSMEDLDVSHPNKCGV